MIKILIVDDHPIVRQGLRQSLSECPDITVLDEAGDGVMALNKISTSPVDLVLLDISIPGRGGIEILKDIKMNYPKLPVLILSMHPEDQYGVRAIKAGASGYVNKASSPDELVEAIRKAASGRRYISETLADNLVMDIKKESDKPFHRLLSDREFEVFKLIAQGKTVSEVAEQLFLSVKTISTYRTRILLKTGMKTNAELTHYAIKNELIKL